MPTPCDLPASPRRKPGCPPSLALLPLGLILSMAAQAGAGDAPGVSPQPGQSGHGEGFTAPVSPAAGRAMGMCPEYLFADGFQAGVPLQADGPGTLLKYRTAGRYTILIDRYTITIADPQGMNTVQHWELRRENLNGKHIKDWGGAPGWSETRRTLVLGDGSKLTMTVPGTHAMVQTTSIYDGDRNVQFDNTSNTITHFSSDPVDTWLRDGAQFDGETALFATDPETLIATYSNAYNETFEANGQTTILPILTPLGTTGGCANPNQVNDLFDDPRWGHT